MNTKEYWNKVAREKKFSIPFQMEEFEEYVGKDKKILDIGCGYGRVLKELYDNSYTDLLGIDISSQMIRKAKENYPFIHFSMTKAEHLEYEDNSIDSVILLAVLTSIVDSKSQQSFIKEVHRILKKNGILYMNDFLLNDSDLYLERYEKYQDKYKEYGIFETSDGGVFRHHSKEYLERLLNDFKCEKVKVLKYSTMNGHVSNGMYYIGRK